MQTISINGKDYKIKYGFNAFADTDLLDRVNDISRLLNAEDVKNDQDVSALGKIKDLFSVVRELMFVGFEKYNPVDSIQEVGDLLDAYHDECPEGETRGLLDVFALLSEELMNEGFLADLMNQTQNIKSIPQDHKKKTVKK